MYAWGLRITEAVSLDVTDFYANAHAPELGRYGMLQVRNGKAPAGGSPKRRSRCVLAAMGCRGLQRDPQRHPARHRRAPSTTPTSRSAWTASRPTRSARTWPTSASTASPTGSTSWPRPAPGSPARSADGCVAPPDRPRWVLGSIGPGHQAADPRPRRRTPTLRDAYQAQADGPDRRRRRRAPRRDRQDLLQAKAADRRRPARDARPPASTLPIYRAGDRRDHRHMLLGSEIGAALTALEPLGIDMIGLNCATGPAEMSEHLRYLARHARIPLSVHAQRRPAGADRRRRALPAHPGRAGRRARHVHRASTASALVGGCCGTTPEHLRQVVERVRGREAVAPRRRVREPGVASLYQTVPFRQDTSYLSIGERTNANGSKAFREAMLERALGRLRRDRPRPDPRRRAPARPVRRLRRPRRRRRHARARRPVRHRVDAADRARLHRAGGASQAGPGDARRPRGRQLGQLRGRRRPRVAVRAGSCRWSRSTAPPSIALTIDEEGQARTAEWKVARRRAADRRTCTGNWGMRGRATSSSTA